MPRSLVRIAHVATPVATLVRVTRVAVCVAALVHVARMLCLHRPRGQTRCGGIALVACGAPLPLPIALNGGTQGGKAGAAGYGGLGYSGPENRSVGRLHMW